MKYNNISNLIFFLVLSFIYIAFSACNKNEDKLPYATINYSFYLSDPAFFKLNSIEGSAFIENEGINGVLVYRKSLEEIVAYDGNCTYKPEDRCGVQLVENEQSAKDSCCGSVFQLFDGNPISGPASLPLYDYRVLIDNDRVIIINN